MYVKPQDWHVHAGRSACLAARRYVLKLVQELEGATAGTFTAPSDRDRSKSVLADLQVPALTDRQLLEGPAFRASRARQLQA